MKHKNTISSLPSLTQYIAQSGVCSRRKAVEYIENKRVVVNNTIVTTPGYRVAPTDTVLVQGEPVVPPCKVYIVLNKPKDYITTVADEKGRKTVIDLIGGAVHDRVYPVGRLDRSTTGLLLLTNDGALAQRLSHPRYETAKLYHVGLNISLNAQDMDEMRKGIYLEDGFMKVDEIEYGTKKSECIVRIHSGKNRVLRRLFEHFGYVVKKLDRFGYAGLTKSGLPIGRWRYLTEQEVQLLKAAGNKKK